MRKGKVKYFKAVKVQFKYFFYVGALSYTWEQNYVGIGNDGESATRDSVK